MEEEILECTTSQVAEGDITVAAEVKQLVLEVVLVSFLLMGRQLPESILEMGLFAYFSIR